MGSSRLGRAKPFPSDKNQERSVEEDAEDDEEGELLSADHELVQMKGLRKVF